MSTSLPVEIEDRQSWPADFLDHALKNYDLVLSYYLEQRRIDNLCEHDVFIRVDPPANPYEHQYDGLVQRLDGILTRHRIVGYHCTRLTPNEILRIKSTGMQVLSKDLVHQRLKRCVADGHLNHDHANYLENSPLVRDSLSNKHGHRTDRIWFCPNRSTLKHDSSVYRLFRSWGGEAVYCNHEEDPNIATVLTNIGIPCIVKCAVPFPCDPPYYPTFAARFLSQLVENDIEYPEPSPRFDLRIRQNVSPDDVLDIIEHSDSRFEQLTNSSSWARHFWINQ